ncbi:putative leader peptide [Streptomyces tsukubensis]|uniref:putative leader peptide n=1 Tax=Streptomyces tsukubensis TaxID=83656 RepID=UPI00351D62AA
MTTRRGESPRKRDPSAAVGRRGRTEEAAVRKVTGRRAVRALTPGGPRIRLYRRQHIDLLRVAGALCRP